MPPMSASQLRSAATRATDAAGLAEELEVSLPIPVKDGAGLRAALFAAVSVPTPDGRNYAIHRPVARVFLDWANASVLSVQVDESAVAVDGSSPVGLARTPEYEGEPFGDADERYRELEVELLAILEAAARAYGAGTDDAVSRRRCGEGFRHLLTAPVMELYRELSPGFFAWLERGPAVSAVPDVPAGPAWAPSHVVPPGGMPAWTRPDPSEPPVATLDPGLPLQVVETLGEWARIVASNGWSAWVDARRLVPGG